MGEAVTWAPSAGLMVTYTFQKHPLGFCLQLWKSGHRDTAQVLGKTQNLGSCETGPDAWATLGPGKGS